MSDTQLTNSEQAIISTMQNLSPEDPRYLVLEAALAFKASWVILAEQLNEVYRGRNFKNWGFPSFSRYCTSELKVTSATAQKLIKSYHWLSHEAPELLPRIENGHVYPEHEVPDINTIKVLADAHENYQAEKVPEDTYLYLKKAALEGEKTATQLRRELKQALPEEEKKIDPLKELRRSLNFCVKTIDALREWDGNDEILLKAEELRDHIIVHLPNPVTDTPPVEVQTPETERTPQE